MVPSARVVVKVCGGVSVSAVAGVRRQRSGSAGQVPATGGEQELLSGHTLLGASPERCGRRAAPQAGLRWEALDEGFAGGPVMISLTEIGLIKARSQLSLQLPQAVLQMISLLFRS